MEFISGESREQIIMLPDCLDDYITDNNSVRVIEAYINSLDMVVLDCSRQQPNTTGRPMYDPKDLLKLYLYGYMNRIRSSRRLERESKRNVELLWLLGKLCPDHKTIAEFRRQNGEALKKVFKSFVKLCVKLGLYGKELLAIDGSKFKAVNSKERNYTDGKLKERIERLDTKIEAYMKELEEADREEGGAGEEKSGEEIREIIKGLEERRERYEGYAEELEGSGESQKSLTDPDSRLMASNGKLEVCYNVQTAVDAKYKLIAAYEVTNDANDKNHLTPTAQAAREVLEAERVSVVADTGYDSVQDIVAGMDVGMDIHVAGTDYDICVPVEETGAVIRGHKDGRCVYHGERNIVLCPMGQVLRPAFYKKTEGKGVFVNREVCKGCTCRCTKETRGKRHEVPMAEATFSTSYNDRGLLVKQVRIHGEWGIMKERKSIVEHPFGTIKRAMEAGYCLMKGKEQVSGEFALTFLAYNLKRTINILGVGTLLKAIAS
jgi:transposase